MERIVFLYPVDLCVKLNYHRLYERNKRETAKFYDLEIYEFTTFADFSEIALN